MNTDEQNGWSGQVHEKHRGGCARNMLWSHLGSVCLELPAVYFLQAAVVSVVAHVSGCHAAQLVERI
jgi:hypothetical protein